ncbi:MAG TPA: hypothetical protein HA256_07715, partial [Methanoregulaceae archaeon]|nr:hypothetical protein [Methanoregulaceae archaeon]
MEREVRGFAGKRQAGFVQDRGELKRADDPGIPLSALDPCRMLSYAPCKTLFLPAPLLQTGIFGCRSGLLLVLFRDYPMDVRVYPARERSRTIP